MVYGGADGSSKLYIASFDPCLLCVPPISKTCANLFFDRSFVYAAPHCWMPLI